MNLAEFNDYELGFAKGVIGARNQVPEIELIDNEPNERAREGIHEGYAFVTGISVSDATKLFKDALTQFVSDSTPATKFTLIEFAQTVIDSVNCATRTDEQHFESKFNAYLRALAKRLGYSLTEQGLFNRETGELLATEEKSIFELLGLEFIPLEEREV